MNYKVLKDFGDLKVDEVVKDTELEQDVLDSMVADGTIVAVDETAPGKTQEELDAEAKAAADAQAASDAQATADKEAADKAAADKATADAEAAAATASQAGEQVEKTFTFNGKTVISKTVRVVEDKEIHHIRLEDGSEMDLTDEEHQAMLDAQKTA